MITWKEYLIESEKTAIYYQWASYHETQDVIKAVYPVLGLIGESWELVETIDEADEQDVLGEIGDQLWYLADISRVYDIKIDWWALRTTDYQPYYPNELCLVILKESSRLANITKKIIRDNNGFIKYDHQTKVDPILSKISSIVLYIINIYLGMSLEYVLQLNLDKLSDRQSRGKLQGDGDNR